jgi:hypothetical protein
MIEIKDLLSRFNKILLSQKGKTESVRGIISEIIKIKIKPGDIKIKNNTIYLKIKPIYKNEIFLKKNQILKKLKEVFSEKHPPNIR